MVSALLSPPSTIRRHGPVALFAGAVSVAAAGAVHLAVVPEHLAEYLLFGLFFAVVGVGQLGAAVAVLLRPGRRLLLTIATAEVLLALLWWVSRTTGLPIGPEPWSPEAVGVPDVLCVVVEVLGAAVLVGLALRGPRERRSAQRADPPRDRARRRRGGGGDVRGGWHGALGHARRRLGQPARPRVWRRARHRAGGRAGPAAGQGVHPHRRVRAPSTGGPAFTYDGTVPGPLLRVTQGDRVRVTLVNRLPVATTLHWHGVRVPAAEDGVAGITQDAVAPGAAFTYEFVAGRRGHVLVPLAPGHRAPDRRRPVRRARRRPARPGPSRRRRPDRAAARRRRRSRRRSRSTAPRATCTSTPARARPCGCASSTPSPRAWTAPRRPRCCSARPIGWSRSTAATSSGPQALGPRRLVLGMGQRADLEFTMPPRAVRLVDSRIAGTPSPLQGFFGPPARAGETVTFGDGPAPAARRSGRRAGVRPADLRRPGRRPDDAHGPTSPPRWCWRGSRLPRRRHAARAHDQRIGVARRAADRRADGQLVGLHMVNDTGEFHPMHLHGHVMTVLAVDGRRADAAARCTSTPCCSARTRPSTSRSAPTTRGSGCCTATCSLHAAMGMSMTINYAGVTTPFTMGSRVGEHPRMSARVGHTGNRAAEPPRRSRARRADRGRRGHRGGGRDRRGGPARAAARGRRRPRAVLAGAGRSPGSVARSRPPSAWSSCSRCSTTCSATRAWLRRSRCSSVLYALAAAGQRGRGRWSCAAAVVLAVSLIPLLPPHPVDLSWAIVGPGGRPGRRRRVRRGRPGPAGRPPRSSCARCAARPSRTRSGG